MVGFLLCQFWALKNVNNLTPGVVHWLVMDFCWASISLESILSCSRAVKSMVLDCPVCGFVGQMVGPWLLAMALLSSLSFFSSLLLLLLAWSLRQKEACEWRNGRVGGASGSWLAEFGSWFLLLFTSV